MAWTRVPPVCLGVVRSLADGSPLVEGGEGTTHGQLPFSRPPGPATGDLRGKRKEHQFYSLPMHDDDVIKWEHFPCYWPFVRGIHWSPENSPHKGQWHGALKFSLICTWTNSEVNNRDAGDLSTHHTHYDITVMWGIWVKFKYRQFSNTRCVL